MKDIDSGALTEAEAEDLLLSFDTLMRDTDSRDGRIVMGGLGRRNPENVRVVLVSSGVKSGL